MVITEHLTYNGKTVATVSVVTRHGVNLKVRFTNGYEVVVPPSMVSAEVLCLAQPAVNFGGAR